MKSRYDYKNKVRDQGLRIGQKVLLQSHRIKPRSDCVLAHKNYVGPYFIVDICAKDGIGPAYRLVECESGKTLRRLISGDRLKPYLAERLELEARLPSRIPTMPKAEPSAPAGDSKQAQGLQASNHQTEPKKANTSSKRQRQQLQRRSDTPTQRNNSKYYPAVEILAERVRNGIKEYLVHFVDGSQCYTADVTPTLLRYYRLKKERTKEQRRRRGRQKRQVPSQ